MTYPRYPRLDPDAIIPAEHRDEFDRPFWVVFLSIAILGITIWLAVFQHNYHPRIYRYSEDLTIYQIGDTELDFNHPEGVFSIWWQSGRRNERLWPR